MKFKLHYLDGLVRDKDTDALRMGGIWHKAREVLNTGGSLDEAIDVINNAYSVTPEWIDSDAWQVEACKLRCGIAVVSELMPERKVIASEQMQQDIIGGVDFKGIIDCIVEMDGKLYIEEYKTTSSDVSPGSEYWDILTIDTQCVGYVALLKAMGYDIHGIIYDVWRKPALRLKKNETIDEYNNRIYNTMLEENEKYYARKPITILRSDEERFVNTLGKIDSLRREMELHNLWYHNEMACKTFGRCEYLAICSNCLEGKAARQEQIDGFVYKEMDDEPV
jgi:hypothetical protein